MEAVEMEMEPPEEHIFRSVGFSHPLVRLMPYGPGAPLFLQELQQHVWRVFNHQIEYPGRLGAALAIRSTLGKLGLTANESANLAIDLLEGLNKLLSSAAVLEQLAWAYLDLAGISLQDRRFSSPPLHPLPVLTRIDSDSGKRVQVDKAHEIANAVGIWTSVTMEFAARPCATLGAMSTVDLRASIRMLILFLLHADLDKCRATRAGGLDRFEDVGLSLWDELLTLLRNAPECRPEDEERFGPSIQRAVWHQLRSRELLRTISTPESSVHETPAPRAGSVATHTVIQGLIPPGSTDEDRQTLARYECLQRPLPVARLPDISGIDSFEDGLRSEFPWATSAIAAVADDLRSRRLFGGLEIGMAPTLLVGPPGCGKSRLARRIAEELGLPFLAMSLAGMGDSRAILGTARGWSGGQASPLVNLVMERASASAIVMLDEIDKACSNTRNDVPPTSALLNLLELENAKRWYDTYLQVACDMSKLMFVATANTLSPIPKPLLSRLRIVLVPEPRPEHFPIIARGALIDIAREWGLPDGTFGELADVMPVAAARNAREIRTFARTYLNDWARKSLGPGRVH